MLVFSCLCSFLEIVSKVWARPDSLMVGEVKPLVRSLNRPTEKGVFCQTEVRKLGESSWDWMISCSAARVASNMGDGLVVE